MKLKRLELTNFMCFKEATLEFPDSESGFYLVYGDNKGRPGAGGNGAGKSTTFDAVCWALYGETGRGWKAKKLLNRDHGSSYSVTAVFDEFTVYRSWNPNFLKLDDKEVDQKELTERVRLTAEQFLYCVYYAQQVTPAQKQFIDLGPTDKLNFLSDLFELNSWIKRGQHCTEELKALLISKSGYETAATGRRVFVESQVSLLLSFDKQIAEEKQRQDAKLEVLQTELATLQVSMGERPDVTPYQQMVDTLSQQRVEASEQREALLRIWNQKQSARAGLQGQLEGVEKELAALTRHENKVCPTCKQTVSGGHVQAMSVPLIERCENLKSAIEAAALECAEASKIVEVRKNEIVQFATLLADATQLVGEVRVQVALYDQQVKRSEQLLKEIATTQDSSFATSIELQKQKVTDIITENETALAELNSQLEAAEKQVVRYEFGAKHFPQFRLFLLDEITKELELHFNQAFSQLGLMGWDIEVSTTKELVTTQTTKRELNLKVSENGRLVDLDTLSGGERQCIKIALAVGISDLIKSHLDTDWQFYFIDEPKHNLSPEGTECLLGMLQSLSGCRQVWLADHGVHELSRFDGILKVTKEPNGISNYSFSN